MTMADEQFTYYPVREYWGGWNASSTDTLVLQRIEEKLNAIEARLSRIEELMAQGGSDK